MKSLRQGAIRDLVASRSIRTQQELVAALRERGLRATQATVSRDIRELGLHKAGPAGRQAWVLPTPQAEAALGSGQRLAQLLRDLPVEVHAIGHLLVIRAVPGSAHAIAAALDRARWPEVLGSVAGDDTLFVACVDEGSALRARDRLLALRG